MFEKSLQDLVKGIRAANNDSAAYIAKAIQEIKDELKSRDVTIKTQALQKLTYLNMMGHDMNWAAFHIIEVMSQERFALKRVGFLAASLSFTATTDVIVLCNQLLKKEFSAKSPFEIGLAISTLANIATPELAENLMSDIVSMLSSSRPYIRKKATLVLYKLYLQYPTGLRLTFDHLKRRLTDDNPAIISCAINVICELARKKPSNYLSLAPDLFNLLTTSSNNWMLIKIAKLMSALVQEEPRLARKLLEPLANIVQNTPAKSLMYECISTITFALQHTKKPDGSDAKNVPAVVRLCTDRLREFVRDPDQNLKYLGLVGLVQLMKSHPRVVAEHRELVLQCLTDEDVTIRLRALELISGMVTRRNLPDIVKSLLGHLETAEGHYRDELISKIIFMCSRDKYGYLADFSWYVGVLAKLAYIKGTQHSATIAGQILDVSVRVEDVRPFAVQTFLPMLADETLFQNARAEVSGTVTTIPAATEGEEESAAAAVVAEGSAVASFSSGRAGAGQVLYAAAWVVGEYCSIIPAQMHSKVIDALLQQSVALLPPAVQAVYVQCAFKILAAAAATAAKGNDGAKDAFLRMAASVLDRLHAFAQSADVEVQERACLIQQLLATLGVPFTPLATPATAAVEKAKAEADLLALLANEDGSNAAATPVNKAPAPLPPLEPNISRIAAVLTSLFAEPLKPVNAKAQRKVPIPSGLNLDVWINPAEETADIEDRRSAFVYNSISFEDSYGVQDDEFAGSSRQRGGTDDRSGFAGRPFEGGVGNGADEDDDAWFDDLDKKNKRRDKELWGANQESDDDGKKKKKGKKGKNDDEDDGGKKKKKDSGKRDPFMLAKDNRGRAATKDSERSDNDIDNIPIKSLDTGALKPSALDVSIFGDFGKKKKDDGEKKKKKKKKDDSDDDDKPVGRTFRIMSDDDMPEGANGDDDDREDNNKSFDALANVDLSTPLGDNETLPTRQHRAVGDPAALREEGKKGKGRARVLGGATEDTSSSSKKDGDKKDKKDKKEKKEKDGDKKDKKEKDSDKKDKKEDKKEKDGDKKDKKEKKEDKKDKSSSSSSSSAAPVTPAVDVSAAPPYSYPLAADKVVRAFYAVSTASNGSSPSEGGYTSPTGVATVVFRFEPKSSKKAVDWIDVSFRDNAAVISNGLTAGASSGSYRIATGLKAKEKDKKHSKKGIVTINVNDPYAAVELPVKITYQVAGSSSSASFEGKVVIRAASLLVPTSIEPEAYRALMQKEGASFVGAASPVSFIGGDVENTLNTALGILRTFAVARSPRHAILYARSTVGISVTALLMVDEANKVVNVTVKSLVPEHAQRILTEVTEAITAAAAEAAKKEDD